MKNTNFSCSQCSKIWQKSGATNCWSNDPENMPPKPGNCPSRDHLEVIRESFELYKGDSAEAKMARVAARVEGLCYAAGAGKRGGECPLDQGGRHHCLCQAHGLRENRHCHLYRPAGGDRPG